MKKIIILFIITFSLCGCTNQKCIKSHQEKSKCTRYTYVKTGNTHIMIPHHYNCTKTICDEYEEVSE